jgi:hypothetical protein
METPRASGVAENWPTFCPSTRRHEDEQVTPHIELASRCVEAMAKHRYLVEKQNAQSGA